MFVVAFIFVCSFFYVVFQWHFVTPEPDFDKIIEQMEQDLELQEMKEKTEMVAAISEEVPQEVATTTRDVPPAEMVQQVAEVEPVETIETTTSEIIVNEEEPVVEEAKVEEVVIAPVQEESQVAEEEHYKSVDALPEFPGGHSAFIQWIDTNLKYPINAAKNKIEGKIVVSFIIDAEGGVQDIKMVQTLNSEIDIAAMKLFMQMPKWKPGVKDGQPCATMIAVPIHFEI